MTTKTDPAADLKAARTRLADLEAEMLGLPDAMRAARSDRDAERWLALHERVEDIEGQVEAARRDVARLEAEAELVAVRSRVADLEDERSSIDSELSKAQAKVERLDRELQEARAQVERLKGRAGAVRGEHAVAVDDQDEIARRVVEFGGRVEGLRNIGRLAATVEMRHPATGQRHQFLAGERPPAWAADLITNPDAWEDPDA